MEFDPESILPPGAKIKVVGVGGGGGNATNTMIRSNLEGVDFVACNTDIQSLRFSLAPTKIQIGKDLTRGLGAGADPDVGREAALEDRHELQQYLEGSDMVFITAGMGGGTGTGGAAVVAQIARELGALTVGVVTKPFSFEGKRRKKHAEAGIARLRECVDTLITIPNQRLLELATPDLSMIDAFKLADEVLVNAVKGISDIINIPGTVNVDFADVKTVMSCMGQALMGIGASEGEKRAAEAAQRAIRSPLLEDIDIEGATGVLVNITAGSNLTLMEVNEACSVVQEAAHEDANFIFGAVIDESLGDAIRVTVIATGFPVDGEDKDTIERIQQQQVRHSAGQGGPHNPFNTRLTEPPLTKRSLLNEPLTSRPLTRPVSPEQRTTTPEPRHQEPLTSQVPHQTQAPVAPKAAPQAPEAQPMQEAATPHASFFEAPQEQNQAEAAQEFDQYPREEASEPRSFDPIPTMELGGTDESEELALWTMGYQPPAQNESSEPQFEEQSPEPEANFEPSHSEPSFEEDDFTPLAETSDTFSDEPLTSATQESPQQPERIEGATARGEPPRVHQKPLADSLFDDQQAELNQEQDEQVSAPQSHTEDPAPLDALFGDEQKLVGSEIDRKIDEALEMAERMKADAANKPENSDDDDLDVPAFLRNGMKDFPLS